jgi:predicted nucleotidyltransferase
MALPQQRGGAFLCVLKMPELCYSVEMERSATIAKLKEHEAELKRLGVEHLYLFGSTARGEAREDSDVDLFFDYQRGKLGLFELMDVKDAAAKILGRKTDIMTRDSLHRTLRRRIEASAVQVF